ncbi:MAG: hypothetical protein ABL956_01145 [Hyphomonadaceae bacterium]
MFASKADVAEAAHRAANAMSDQLSFPPAPTQWRLRADAGASTDEKLTAAR